MMRKKVVFCEMGFLQQFLDDCPLMQPNDESLRYVESWMSFYLFFSKADIILDVTAKEFVFQVNQNEWLKRLWKKSTDNQCGLEFAKEEFPDVFSINGSKAASKILNAVFLTTKDADLCKKKSEELGIFIFNPEMARHCNHLFCDNGTSFPNENAKDWNFMKGLTGPNTIPSISVSNSMLIIDNYILCDDRDFDYKKKMECNLMPIFQNILPTKLSEGETYDITLFVGSRKERSHLYDEQYDYLQNMIRKIRKDLNFRLSIFIGKQDTFHDRSIVTNNVMINSGYGFGILRYNGKTSTQTSVNIVFPFFQTKIAWCDNAFLNILQTAKKITDYLHSPNMNCWGDHQEENRLITYYNLKKTKATRPVLFSEMLDSSRPTGRVIGKIDLSTIIDYGSRRSYGN